MKLSLSKHMQAFSVIDLTPGIKSCCSHKLLFCRLSVFLSFFFFFTVKTVINNLRIYITIVTKKACGGMCSHDNKSKLLSHNSKRYV